jgi:hypothetical protein
MRHAVTLQRFILSAQTAIQTLTTTMVRKLNKAADINDFPAILHTNLIGSFQKNFRAR